MDRPTSMAIARRNTSPNTSSRRCSPRVLWMTFTSMSPPRSPGDPDRGGGAPDREAQEEVRDHHRHDRGADGPADRDAHTGGAARGGVAVVAVDQDDRDRQEDQLAERPQHVDGRQE